MSEYQVIARKWRPRRFSDVVGQQHVVRTLRNAINSGRTAHAYLFVGPRGIGKTTLARIFAKALNCSAPVDGEPCCQCESCQAIMADRSLDVVEVDAASHNSTNDMRNLSEDVLTRPVGGRYKIYIIDEVHMLSKAAWNVLLKTVEEPPEHVKFIFATTEVHQVLPTIISRCQRFDLMPIPTRLIAERLKLIADSEKVAIDQDAINAIARAADGGMRDAQSLLDQMIAFFTGGDGSLITGSQVLSLFGLTDRHDLFAILQAMLLNQPGSVVTLVGNLAKKGKNLETLFDDILAALRAINLSALLHDPGDLINEGPEMIDYYRKTAALAPAESIQIMLETLSPVGRILHDALNKQIFLETILLKSMREAHAVRLSDLLGRLNQLRSAGELKFLDQLPPAEKTVPVLPELPAPTTPIAQPEAPITQPEEPITQPEAEPETLQPEEPAAPEKLTVAASGDNVQIDLSATSDADDADANADQSPSNDDPENWETPALPVDLALADAAATGSNDLAPEEKDRPRERRSIANDHPEALQQASENPVVAEVIDLFAGNVVDIHR